MGGIIGVIGLSIWWHLFRPHFCSNSGNDSTSLAQLQSRLLSIKNAPLLTFPPRQVNTSRQNGSVRRVYPSVHGRRAAWRLLGGRSGRKGRTDNGSGGLGMKGAAWSCWISSACSKQCGVTLVAECSRYLQMDPGRLAKCEGKCRTAIQKRLDSKN